ATPPSSASRRRPPRSWWPRSPAPPTTSSPSVPSVAPPPKEVARMADPTVEPGPAVPMPSDLSDERLVHGAGGLAGGLASLGRRLRGGDLGSLPVIVGLVVISIVFYAQEPAFLSSR